MSREALTEEQIKWAHEKYCEGYSAEEIAAALFIGRRTLFRAFKKRNLKKAKQPLETEKMALHSAT